jgi:hypothetical protein
MDALGAGTTTKETETARDRERSFVDFAGLKVGRHRDARPRRLRANVTHSSLVPLESACLPASDPRL